MKNYNSLKPKDEEKIYRWLIHGQAETASAEQRESFGAWLSQNALRQHKAEQVNSIWRDPQLIAALKSLEEDTDRQRISINEAATRAPTTVVPIDRPRRPLTFLAVAATLTGVIFAAAFQYSARFASDAPAAEVVNAFYATRHQELNHSDLADGSKMDMSANSKVRVAFSTHERHVQLYEGEVQFQVAKDVHRPFVVESRHARLQALGTVFNVDQRGGATELTVLEGQVTVHPQQRPDSQKVISAGERITVAADKLLNLQIFDLDTYKDWLQGWIRADNLRLADLLIELNRFSPTRLFAEDPATRNLLVSGWFELEKTEKNIEILKTLHHLQVSREEDGVRLETVP